MESRYQGFGLYILVTLAGLSMCAENETGSASMSIGSPENSVFMDGDKGILTLSPPDEADSNSQPRVPKFFFNLLEAPFRSLRSHRSSSSGDNATARSDDETELVDILGEDFGKNKKVGKESQPGSWSSLFSALKGVRKNTRFGLIESHSEPQTMTKVSSVRNTHKPFGPLVQLNPQFSFTLGSHLTPGAFAPPMQVGPHQQQQPQSYSHPTYPSSNPQPQSYYTNHAQQIAYTDGKQTSNYGTDTQQGPTHPQQPNVMDVQQLYHQMPAMGSHGGQQTPQPVITNYPVSGFQQNIPQISEHQQIGSNSGFSYNGYPLTSKDPMMTKADLNNYKNEIPLRTSGPKQQMEVLPCGLRFGLSPCPPFDTNPQNHVPIRQMSPYYIHNPRRQILTEPLETIVHLEYAPRKRVFRTKPSTSRREEPTYAIVEPTLGFERYEDHADYYLDGFNAHSGSEEEVPAPSKKPTRSQSFAVPRVSLLQQSTITGSEDDLEFSNGFAVPTRLQKPKRSRKTASSLATTAWKDQLDHVIQVGAEHHHEQAPTHQRSEVAFFAQQPTHAGDFAGVYRSAEHAPVSVYLPSARQTPGAEANVSRRRLDAKRNYRFSKSVSPPAESVSSSSDANPVMTSVSTHNNDDEQKNKTEVIR